MEASPIKLLRLLGDNETVFKVPVYQRKYEWNKEQIDQYFSDIERIIKSDYENEHFLGTIVYVQNDLPDLMKERLLIDGQQRVTTSFILLKAIMDIIKEQDQGNITWKKIRDTYLVNPYGKGDTEIKLMPVDSDKIAYNELLLGNEMDSKIHENYNICREKILASEYNVEEIYKALGLINIVYISLDRSENPQIIFESLNSTGLSLNQSDLIRNFILMGLDYDMQNKLYNNYWKKIEKLLPNKVISEFVRDYLTMKEGVVPNQNKVYDAFKLFYYDNKFSSEEILIELLRYSNYYEIIINSNSSYDKINIQLNYINTIRNTVSYPVLLKVFDDFYFKKIISCDELEEVLKIMVSYVYRRNICNIPTNALNNIFARLTKEIDIKLEKGYEYTDAVVDYLMSRTGTGIFPRDEEFRQNFISIDMYNKSNKLSKVVLHTIEKSLHKEVVDMEILSVEHILPQTLTNEWSIELGKNSHEVYRLYRNTIGNLTLTNYNSEMSNNSFQVKKEYYKNSNIQITREISKIDSWTQESILQRANELFEIIKDIWKLPKDDYKNIIEDRLSPNEEYSVKDNILVTGYIPKTLIIDNERYQVNSWREMLTTVCNYIYELDEELFLSLQHNKRFERLLNSDKNSLRDAKKFKEGLFIEVNYNAKDILSYIGLLAEEYEIEDLIFFQIK